VHGDTVRCGASAVELVCELAGREPAGDRRGDVDREIGQLHERVEALEKERGVRDARICELREEARVLGATLGSVREELVHSRELHETALAELRHQSATERTELMTVSKLYDARVRELSETQMVVAELQQIIDAQQTRHDHG
jgi:chromosome segregation ATPase